MFPQNNILTPVPTVYGYFNQKYGALWQSQVEALKADFPNGVIEIQMPGLDRVDLPTVYAKKDEILAVLLNLKTKHGYTFLTDLTATDESEEQRSDGKRFLVVYHLFNIENKARIRVKVAISDNETMPTAIALWAGANWAEREVFDMFGIHFDGHPDLRRILMDQRFVGHPLRKDYPLRGYQVFLTPEPINPELLK